MKNIIAMILFALPCFVFALPPAAAGYGLAWSDEFNGASLDTVNNWNYDTGMVYCCEQESYHRACVTVENGNLVIWSKLNTYGGYSPYASGRIDTHDKKTFTYGYFEVRMITPVGQVSGPGLWSSVWLLGNSIQHGVGWPACGEMELYDQRPSNAVVPANAPQPVPAIIGDNEFIASCHYAGVTGGPSYHQLQRNYSTCLCDGYHTYGLLWDSTQVKYYFDDTLYWGPDYPIVNGVNFGTPSITLPENTVAFHSPFYWIINVTVGGNYQGQNIDKAIFPTKMLIDYVRVYQKSAPVATTQQKRTLPNAALLNSSQANVKLYDLQGRFVGDFSGLPGMTEHDGSLFVNAVKSNIPQGVYLARISNGRHFVNERLVIKNK
jgi:beta-glucanase (GH16 family)